MFLEILITGIHQIRHHPRLEIVIHEVDYSENRHSNYVYDKDEHNDTQRLIDVPIRGGGSERINQIAIQKGDIRLQNREN